jgi:hypothetical protein
MDLKEVTINNPNNPHFHQVQPEHDYAVEAGIDYFDSLMENPDETPLTISNDNLVIAELMEVVNNIKDSLPDSDLTRLWLTYIDMYDILLMNLHAERLGDWDKYISSLRLMLPYMVGLLSFHHIIIIKIFIRFET